MTSDHFVVIQIPNKLDLLSLTHSTIDVLLRGVALTSFFEEYLYYAMSTNLIPPILCIECLPAYAIPTNSLIGPLAAEPQSIHTHLKIIGDILATADMGRHSPYQLFFRTK